MKVPVKVSVDTDNKEFEVSVGTPTASALLVSELGVSKGSGVPNTEKIGDMTLEQVLKVAKMKREDILGKDLKAAVKEVLGTGVSMGVTVEGKDPREIQTEIDEGKHDALLTG
jgi:large subunit ribosomal protein L11